MSEEMGDRRSEDRRSKDDSRWHLKKEIQLTHVITTLTVAVSVIIYSQKMEQRIAILESQQIAQRDRDALQDRTVSDSFGLIRAQLDKLDAKLDRTLEGLRK